MRLRSFIAHDMAEALAMVRREMGPDAIIISSERSRGGNLEVRAAIEDPWPEQGPPPAPDIAPSAPSAAPEPLFDDSQEPPPPTSPDEAGVSLNAAAALAGSLAWHGAPAKLAHELARSATAMGETEPVPALALALETRFSFRPVQPGGRRPVLLVGPPGAGKSSACGKLAARAALAGQGARLICADTVRAGARVQLETYAQAAQADFAFAEDISQLRQFASAGEALVVIDGPAANPFEEDDLAMLLAMAETAGAEPVLVLDAGMRAEEAAANALAFARIGARRLIVTKLDAVSHKGAALAAAEAGGLAFAQVSASPFLVGGFTPATPLRLARLLLEEAESGAVEAAGLFAADAPMVEA